MLYTTNAIESLNMQIRKVIKTRGYFPTDEAASKLLFLALRNIEKKWRAPRARVARRIAAPEAALRLTPARIRVTRSRTHTQNS